MVTIHEEPVQISILKRRQQDTNMDPSKHKSDSLTCVEDSEYSHNVKTDNKSVEYF